jgi:hypothetical protein
MEGLSELFKENESSERKYCWIRCGNYGGWNPHEIDEINFQPVARSVLSSL